MKLCGETVMTVVVLGPLKLKNSFRRKQAVVLCFAATFK